MFSESLPGWQTTAQQHQKPSKKRPEIKRLPAFHSPLLAPHCLQRNAHFTPENASGITEFYKEKSAKSKDFSDSNQLRKSWTSRKHKRKRTAMDQHIHKIRDASAKSREEYP